MGFLRRYGWVTAALLLAAAVASASDGHVWMKISSEEIDGTVICHWRCEGSNHGGKVHFESTGGLGYCGLP